ncbi:MAG: V-type ATPase subunit [Clostridiales bacterium]|jgi:V/A-type H+-transporting ATPase subunit C|nr:V-type ATPase subunit [Clostridiales bacterium]
MNKSSLYSSAVVTARGGKLLNADRARRMIDARSAGEAVKVLYECGYNENAVGEGAGDVDGLLSDEMKKTAAAFDELVSDAHLRETVLKRYDYHNAKVFLKQKYAGGEAAFYPFGLTAPEKIKEAVASGNFADLRVPLAAALAALAAEFDKAAPSGRKIDVALDKAYFADAAESAGKIRSKAIRDYYRAEADVANLSICARSRRLGFSEADARAQLVSGGALPLEAALAAMGGDAERLTAAYAGAKCLPLVKTLCACLRRDADLTAFEAAAEEFLLSLTRRAVVDYNSEEPLFRWFIQKLAELKTVKLILVCKGNGLPDEEIRKRLKAIYL